MSGTALAVQTIPAIREATSVDCEVGFDYTSRYYLGISGQEFLRKLDAHELGEDDARVREVMNRLWLVRPEAAE